MNEAPQRVTMTRPGALLFTIALLLGGVVPARIAAATALGSGNPENVGSQISIRVGTDGLPVQLEWKKGPTNGALRGPCHLFLESSQGMILVPPLHEVGPGEWAADWQAQHLHLVVQYGVTPDTNIVFTVQNLSLQARKVQLELVLPVIAEADHTFIPAGSEPRVALHPGGSERVYSYGTREGILSALPLGTVYSPKDDWGLGILGDEQAPIAGLVFKVTPSKDETTVKVLFPDIDLDPVGTVVRRLYLTGTAGDWRPALAAALALFPREFQPKDFEFLESSSTVAELWGPFLSSNGTPPDDKIADWYAQGTRVLEIHGVAPLYGMYVPDREPFVPFVDGAWYFLKKHLHHYPSEEASWREIRDFVETYKQPTMTKEKINDYIERLHRHGIKGLIYINPTEAWAPWAAAEFPHDRVIRPDGTFQPEWLSSVKMIADRNRPWGRYILDQLRGELKIFPQVDGVFFDQSAQGGHDLYELCAEGCRVVRALGKICWWNGPYNAELASLADGMMTEGGGTQRYRALTEIIQYYGIAGKPIVSLGPANPEAYSEMLLHGVTPQPVSPEQKELAERWFPLFRHLRNRRWVLQAHALETDPDLAANIFQVANGDYAIPLVPNPGATAGKSSLSSSEVKVRVEDGDDVKAVFLLTPDQPGYHQLPFHRTAGMITIPLPNFSPAGLLVLSKSGVMVVSSVCF
jgi:hypothetical protein